MQKFSTWMIVALDVMFWLLRVVTAYTSSMGMEFMATPMNMQMEVMMIFIALICFIFIVKRKFIGAIVYLIGYWGYFGVELVDKLPKLSEGTLSAESYMNTFFALIGVALPLFTLLDLVLDKNRQLNPTDKKTDWFYKDKKYDMKKDERADKNNYRNL